MMQKFCQKKWAAYVESVGGWEKVVEKVKQSPLYETLIEDNSFFHCGTVDFNSIYFCEENIMRVSPLARGEDCDAEFFCCLNLDINDFLTTETVDVRTALKVLADGGVVKDSNGMKFSFESGRGIVANSVGFACFYSEEYEVVSWGDYKDE